MRYSAEHKAASRQRILESARALFRSRGFEGASIDQVTHAAGLTRGTFYSHFESKDDLVRHVLAIEAGLVNSLDRARDAHASRAAAVAAFKDYLDPDQRDDVAGGCPLVAHPVDAIRGGAGRKEGYTHRLRALIDGISATMDDPDTGDAAILVSVLAVGGALLSAASADAQLADRIAAVSLANIEAAYRTKDGVAETAAS